MFNVSKKTQTHTHTHKYYKKLGCWKGILRNIIYVFNDINQIYEITLEYEHCFMCLLKYPFVSCGSLSPQRVSPPPPCVNLVKMACVDVSNLYSHKESKCTRKHAKVEPSNILNYFYITRYSFQEFPYFLDSPKVVHKLLSNSSNTHVRNPCISTSWEHVMHTHHTHGWGRKCVDDIRKGLR